MPTVILGLLSSLSYAVSDMFSQRVTRSTSVVRVMLWILGVGVVFVLPAALLADGLPGGAAQWHAAGLAAVAGAIYLGAYFSLLVGLRRGDLSLITALSALQGAFAAVIAIVAGEQVTALVAVGLVLAVAGGTLSSLQGKARTTAGAGWALLSAGLFALDMLLYDQAQALSWLSVAAVSRTVSLLLLVPVALLVGRGAVSGAALTPRLRATVVLAGVLEMFGLVLLTASVSIGPLAVAGVMVSQFATFGLLLGLIVLKERPRPHQLAGVVCTIVAVSILGLAA